MKWDFSVSLVIQVIVLPLSSLNILYIYISAVKRLIAINRIQNKRFCLHNVCECAVYIYYVYKYTHMHVYI